MPASAKADSSYLDQIEGLTKQLDAAEQQSRATGQLVRTIIDKAPLGIIVCDCQGRFIVWNERAHALINKGPRDVRPDEWPETYQLYNPLNHAQLVDEVPLAKALRTGEVVHAYLWVGNGSQRYIECTAEPVYCPQDELIGAVIYLQ